MAVDPSLLTKAAKVYEAAEAVDGVKPKEVYESHKKCAPGEFGMHKEGGSKQADLDNALTGAVGLGGIGALGGGALGGTYGLLSGAYQSPRGKKLRGALAGMARGAGGGALIGGGLGAGAGAGIMAGMPKGITAADDLIREHAEGEINGDPIKYLSRILGGGGLGLAAGGALGSAADHALFADKKEDKDTDKKDMKKKGALDDLASMASGTSPHFSPTVGQGALTGAGLGALIGALRAPKGKMLKYTLGGAGIGGLTGAGSTAAYNLHDSMNFSQPYNSLTRLPATIGAGALAGHLGNKMYDEVEEHIPEKKEKQDSKKDKKETEKESAYAFGRLVKEALDPAVGYGAAGGGLLGAGLGGLAGFINPGEEEDETGRVRRRSRFGAALRGALGGGVAGALGGGALGSFNPNLVHDARRALFGKTDSGVVSPVPSRPAIDDVLPGSARPTTAPSVRGVSLEQPLPPEQVMSINPSATTGGMPQRSEFF